MSRQMLITDVNHQEYLVNLDELLPLSFSDSVRGKDTFTIHIGRGKEIVIDQVWYQELLWIAEHPSRIAMILVFRKREMLKQDQLIREMTEVIVNRNKEINRLKTDHDSQINQLKAEISALQAIQARLTKTTVTDLGIGDIVDNSPSECYDKSHLDLIP